MLVTSGATEALTAAIMALAGQGDEVVLIEPSYDCYRPIAEARGRRRAQAVKLAPPDWRLTEEALRASIGPKTRAIVINTPLNPIGRVFDREEIATLARVVKDTDAVVICDEVYEHLVFDGKAAASPLIDLAGHARALRADRLGGKDVLADRLEGRLGHGAAPAGRCGRQGASVPHLHHAAGAADSASPMAWTHEMDFTLALTRELQANRDILANGIARLGFKPLALRGHIFSHGGHQRARPMKRIVAFCERLVREAGVALIPLERVLQGRQARRSGALRFLQKADCPRRVHRPA